MVAVTKKKIPGPTSEIAAFTKKSQQLKLEADVLFAKGSHGEALAKYNKAQQLALRGSAEFVAIATNKAAVYLRGGVPSQAINECDAALDAQPTYKPALLRRATAYEALQEYTKAKTDIERALAIDSSDDSVRNRLDKVKSLAAKAAKASRPAGMGGAGVGKQPAQKYTKEQIAALRAEVLRQQAAQQAAETKFTFDVTYEGEVKSIQLPVSLKYSDLTDSIKKEFDIKTHVAVKYKDFDNDFITITSRMDLRSALTNFAAMAEHNIAGD